MSITYLIYIIVGVIVLIVLLKLLAGLVLSAEYYKFKPITNIGNKSLRTKCHRFEVLNWVYAY